MSYESFAAVYDIFMDDVPYDSWCAYICRVLRDAGIRDGLVCELGCGTGSMTVRLAKAGYDMIGIDVSEDMLAAAQEKAARPDILYLQQDMREFELYGTVRAVVSVCDSLNYITEEDGLLRVFRLVNNYLDPGGLFLFDLNMAARYEAIGDTTIAEDRPEGSFIWENSYDPASGMNRYDLTLFLPAGEEAETREGGEGRSAALYRRFDETHLERAYDTETVRRLLEEAGLAFISATEAYTGAGVTDHTERVLFAARECTKRA